MEVRPSTAPRGRACGLAAVLLGAALLATLAGPAHADVALRERTVHYEVAGRTLADLRRQIESGRPRDASGKPFDGLTAWSIEWQADYQPDHRPNRPLPHGSATAPRGCRVDGHRVSLDLSTTLPRWSGRERAPAALGRAWDAYLAALHAHESEHRALALAAAQRIDAVLRAATAGPDCRELQWRVGKAVGRIQRRLAVDNSLFDRRTKHGRERGVVL